MARNKKDEQQPLQPIIIKRVKKVAGGVHHGGSAWKVAYADFVTAMMAFFLLLWLLSVTTSEQKSAISSYFDPTPSVISDPDSGSGGLMGGTSISTTGIMTSELQPVVPPSTTGSNVRGQEISEDPKDPAQIKKNELEEQLKREEEERFTQMQEDLRRAIEESDELRELAESVVMDMTPEGLRIQIIDKEGKPLFPSGSAEMYDYTEKLLTKVAELASKLPNDVSIRGHTDSHRYAPGAKYTNWELSADRANSSRRVLLKGGIQTDRVANVMGKADQEPYIKGNPFDPQNRRISIILLHETLEHALKSGSLNSSQKKSVPSYRRPAKPIAPFQRTLGDIQFP